jgi:hypothetical protein
VRRRRKSIKPKATKLRVRQSHDRSGTQRVIEPEDMPNGCSHVRDGNIPCTHRMSHIDVKMERRFVPEENEMQTVLKIIGYCKTHRPKTTARVMELPPDLDRILNGPRSARQRMKRMENAMYIYVVPRGGVIRHSALRESLYGRHMLLKEWVGPVEALCGKRMTRGYVPSLQESREDYPKTCGKCDSMRKVVDDE